MSTEYGFDTIQVRGAYDPTKHNYAVQVPIYETAAFSAETPERFDRLKLVKEPGFLYSRLANPTNAVLEQRIAQLDGAVAAVATGSGMAAVTYALLAVSEKGGRILTTEQIYGGTVDAFKSVLGNFGLVFDKVPSAADPAAFESAIKPDTKAIFIESISNPLAVIADIEEIANIAHKHDIPLIVDNTVATPYLINPIKFGADVVVYSTTKAISGHGSAIGGLVEESGKFNWGNGKFPQFTEPNYNIKDEFGKERSFVEAFPKFPFVVKIRKHYVGYFGAALSPFDAYLTILGLETLSERVSKQVSNTNAIIEYLKTQKRVSWISYPTEESNESHHLLDKYAPKGAGGLFSFGFKGDEEDISLFIRSLKIFGYQTNLGDARSLIVNAAKTTHGELTPGELEKVGIGYETLRISVGIEDVNDLINDLDNAFRVLEKAEVA